MRDWMMQKLQDELEAEVDDARSTAYYEQQEEAKHQVRMRRWHIVIGFEFGVLASLFTYFFTN